MTIREIMEEAGIPESQIEAVEAACEAEWQDEAWRRTQEVVHRIFIRVGSDSVHGRALARALGFGSEVSLDRAARAFCVSKQYLHRVQGEIAAKLPGLAGPVDGS